MLSVLPEIFQMHIVHSLNLLYVIELFAAECSTCT